MTPIDLPANCTWCGHEPHDKPCAREITTATGKNPESKPCPCRQHERTTA